jgi:hypothetical protein
LYGVATIAPESGVHVQARDSASLVKVRSVVRASSLDPLDVQPLVDLVGRAYQRAQPHKGATS